MNPAIDYLLTTNDFESIDNRYMKTYWNHMPFLLLFDNDGEAFFDGLQFKRDWDIQMAKLESDNSIQAIQQNYDQIAYYRRNLYIPEYD